MRAADFHRLAGAGLLAAALLIPTPALGISRAEIIDRAKAFCNHPWRCTATNLQASCDSGWSTDYVVGDQMGLPYDWGGWVTLHQFDADIENGLAAGSPPGGDSTACTTGIDCSGYVSQCWATPIKYGTWTILDVCGQQPITVDDLLPGDALNSAGSHIVLYGAELGDGTLLYYEAMPPVVALNWVSSWSGVSGFEPIRYDDIEEGGSDLGTLSNPIPITTWPFTDTRNTRDSESDLLDECAAQPGTRESGQEFVYSFTTTTPGRLTVVLSDGSGTDIDLHLYTAAAERDCIARDDDTLDLPLTACGTYLLVADTWVNASGTEYPGMYTFTADFEPSGGACGDLPGYDFTGGPGDACANPYDGSLPFCNLNLGVYVCLYSSTESFCSRPCTAAADCEPDFPGGCCVDIGSSELYCLPASECEPEPDGGVDAGVDAGQDGGVDAGQDAGFDAGADGGSDPGADTGFDAGWDGGSDPGSDSGTGEDTGADSGPGDPGNPTDDGSDGSTLPDSGGPDTGPCPAGYHLENGGCMPDGTEPPASCGCGSGGGNAGGAGLWWLLLGLAALGIKSHGPHPVPRRMGPVTKACDRPGLP